MINHQQKNTDQNSLNNSLLINKMTRESRKILKKYQLKNKIKSKPQPYKPTPNRNQYQTIDYEIGSDSRRFYDPVRVKVRQRDVSRMTQSSCQKSKCSNSHDSKINEYLLAERARLFVSRIRKQKNYRQGRFLLKKKEQEKKHQNIRLRKLQQQNHKMSLSREMKIANAMQNILKHEQRINSRLSINLYRLASYDSKRYRTQETKRQDIDGELSLSVSRHKLDSQNEKVLSLQKKIKSLSMKIKQLCKE